MIRAERISRTSVRGRNGLRIPLDLIRPSDELVVSRVDLPARSMDDRRDIVRELKAKGATLRATEQSIEASTLAGKAFLDMLGVFEEFGTNLRCERQMEGIAKAKVPSVYKGRRASIKLDEVRRLLAKGVQPSTVVRQLGISRTSVWRVRQPMAADGAGEAILPLWSGVGIVLHGSVSAASRDEAHSERRDLSRERALSRDTAMSNGNLRSPRPIADGQDRFRRGSGVGL